MEPLQEEAAAQRRAEEAAAARHQAEVTAEVTARRELLQDLQQTAELRKAAASSRLARVRACGRA